MKMRVLLFVILCLSVGGAYSQAPLVKEWDKRYGGTSQDMLNSFIQTIDGGFLLGGTSSSGVGGDKSEAFRGGQSPGGDYWVVKTDSAGNKQWDKTFGGSWNEFYHGAVQTHDTGYLLFGYTDSPASGDISELGWDGGQPFGYDFWIVKLDGNGNKKWDKRYGGSGTDALRAVVPTGDCGFLLAGQSDAGISGTKTQTSRGGSDYWVVKIDSVGNKEWDRRYGSPLSDNLVSAQKTRDGGFVLSGQSYGGIGGDKTETNWGSVGTTDYWVVKIDSAGAKQWDKRFGGTESDWACMVKQTNDGGFLVASTSKSPVSGDKTAALLDANTLRGEEDFWVVKLDENGTKLWDKKYGGLNTEDFFGSLFITSDGGFLLAGSSCSGVDGDKTDPNLGAEQPWMVKCDSAGNKQWDKVMRISSSAGQNDNGFALQTKDGYVFASRTPVGPSSTATITQPARGSWDYVLVKYKDTSANFIGTERPVLETCLCSSSAGGIITALRDTVCRDQPPILHFSGIVQNVQWQYSTDGTNYTDLIGLTGEDCLDIPTQTSYYRVKSTDGDCPLMTEPIKIVVDTTCQITEVSDQWPVSSAQLIVAGEQLIVSSSLVGSKMEVYDANGRVVFQSTINQQQTTLSLPVPAGVYFVRVQSERGNVMKKFIRL